MKKEKSAGAIIYRLEKSQPLYLLLHYPSSTKAKKEYWDLPKGHMEKGETEEETAVREVKEETGLADIGLLKGFREEISYWFQWEGEKVFKTVAFFAGQTHTREVAISKEHIDFRWLPYEEALGQLTYQNAKTILKKARDAIREKSV